jgi:hypothetical protein
MVAVQAGRASALEYDLECVAVRRVGEHVVGVHGVGEREAVGDEGGWVEPPVGDQP